MVTIRNEKYFETMTLLEKAKSALSDLSDIYEKWLDYYRGDIISTTWQTQGAMQGLRWAELKPKYRAWKEKHYPDMPKLILTGKMVLAALGGEGGITSISNRVLEFGINLDEVPYARIHQEGGSTGRAYIPQRPYLYMKDSTLTGRAIQKLKNLINDKMEKIK